jgi:hypothetical protein
MAEYIVTLYTGNGTRDYIGAGDTHDAAIDDAKWYAANQDNIIAPKLKTWRRAPINDTEARYLARVLAEAAGRGWYDLANDEQQARLRFDGLMDTDKARVRALQAA